MIKSVPITGLDTGQIKGGQLLTWCRDGHQIDRVVNEELKNYVLRLRILSTIEAIETDLAAVPEQEKEAKQHLKQAEQAIAETDKKIENAWHRAPTDRDLALGDIEKLEAAKSDLIDQVKRCEANLEQLPDVVEKLEAGRDLLRSELEKVPVTIFEMNGAH